MRRTIEEVVDEIARYNSMDALAIEYVRGQIGKRLSEILEIHKAEQQKWIPVSSGMLPEDGELILFSTKTDRVFEGRYFNDNTDRQWYSFRDETFAWNNVVTAWMPLPEPYKAESEKEK